MESQIGHINMLSPLALTGLMVFLLPVQGLDLGLLTNPTELLGAVAELAVWESLGVSDDDFASGDSFATSLGVDDPPDYNSMRFVLFNKANRENGTEITADPESLKKALNPDLPTKIFIHGFSNTLNSIPALLIRDGYLDHADYNLILVDWVQLAAGPNYFAARSHTVSVANRTALLLDALAQSNISASKDQHIIGHSLGAQVAGMAAGAAETRPGRCTGLDPAGPLYELSTNEGRIDATDADLVDIIHTTGALWGFPGPMGDVDFYPNGGVWPQPRCSPDIGGSCSHTMAVNFFAHTISHPNAFEGYLCHTHGVIRGDCPNSTEKATMGEYVKFDTPGIYYLKAEVSP